MDAPQSIVSIGIDAAGGAPPSADVAFAYHTRTKHDLKRYAAGPETLDWDTQPNPFREFSGSARTPLPLTADHLTTTFAQIYQPPGAPAPLTLASVAALLELSMGLSAWKEYGPDRWALRCNPSSGNLHPTEAYVLSANVPGLDDGLHHYVSRDHVLEQRCRRAGRSAAPARLWIGLASIHWREAWKYGERAFRYCQLDIGHALGAIRYAAGALGWQATVVGGVESAALRAAMGLDRAGDFAGAEPEDADLLIAITPGSTAPDEKQNVPEAFDTAADHWSGQANRLDPHPMYRWPVIDEVSAATHGRATDEPAAPLPYPPLPEGATARAADIILGRRSAQRFDARHTIGADHFHRLLDCLLARPAAPWDVWCFAPRLHPVLFVHRVEGLAPGVYALPRHPEAMSALRQELRSDFEWQRPDGVPAHLPLFRLLTTDCRATSRTASCHQAIASDGGFSLSMVAEFEPIVGADPWRYRQLYWEAGLLGQVLYLEAEAARLRGTGIGCYFDDAVHTLLGIETRRFQALYHFTVGRPLTDDRITTFPAYPGRERNERWEAAP
ncbi:MAG: nitroreductase family protein [Xanthobacteraceae bacterium]|nr:nitroreductase family protein [Xanthobacteraceae bacterium]